MQTDYFRHPRVLGPGLSAIILIAMVLWLVTGTLKSQPNTAAALKPAETTRPLTPVTVSQPKKQLITPNLTVYGLVTANKQVTIKAQREGAITKKTIQLGQSVAANTLLAEIDPRDLDAQLTAAEADLARQKSELQAAKRLQKQKLVGQTRLDEANAAFTQASARIAQIKSEQSLRKVEAPFSGFIDALFIEVGEFVQIGAPLFRLVDLTDIAIIGEIAEADLHRIFVGQTAQVTLNAKNSLTKGIPNDQPITGRVTHVSKIPQATTRTYPFEISVDAPSALPALGLSATIDLIAPPQPAFLISPALLQLNDQGVLGVKTIDTHDRVTFKAIEILKAESDGLWISGLSETERVITIGQGYVHIGEKVRATEKN